MITRVIAQLGFRRGRACFQDDKCVGRLAPALVRHSYNCHLLNGWMSQQGAFDFHRRNIFATAEGYLLNNFFFAPASSLSFPSSTFGYARSSEARVSITAAATITRVNHLLSAGTTYHGASFVAVS